MVLSFRRPLLLPLLSFFGFLLTLVFVLALSTAGAAPEQTFEQLYAAGKYEEAAKALRARPTETAPFFYNLGTTELKLGNAGRAVAYLEKANRLRPHETDIQHNLMAARGGLAKLLGEDRLDPVSTSLESLADQIPLDEVRGVLGLVGIITALIWLRSYWRSRSLRATLLHPAGYLGLFAFFLTVALYGLQRFAEANPPIVMVERTLVRSGPGERFLELAQVDAGMKLRFLGEEAPSSDPGAPDSGELWRQVRYSGENIGWIRASSMLLL